MEPGLNTGSPTSPQRDYKALPLFTPLLSSHLSIHLHPATCPPVHRTALYLPSTASVLSILLSNHIQSSVHLSTRVTKLLHTLWMLTLKSCIPGNSSVPGKMIHLAHPSVSLASLIAPMCSKPICPPTLTSLATLSLEGRQDSTPLPNSAHVPPLPEAATTNPGALATALFGPPSLRAGFPVRANSEGLGE